MKRREKIISISFLIIVTSIIYLPALKNNFIIWDDNFTIVDNLLFQRISIEGWHRLFAQFYHFDYYPVFYGSLWLDHLFWETNPVGFHLFNILCHCCNVLLVFGLIHRLFPSERGCFRIALITAIIFAVHPVNVEPVAWATGRKILLASFFALISFHAYLNSKDRGRKKRFWGILSVLSFGLGCLSNIYILSLPLFLVAYDLILKGERRGEAIRSKWSFWLIAIIAVVLKFAQRQEGADVYRFRLWIGAEWFYTTLTNFGQNIVSLFFPLRLSARYPANVVDSPDQTGVWLGLFLIILLLGAGWRFRKRKLVLFGLLWFILGLAPVSQLLRHHTFRADRFLYLPAVGLYILFALFLVFLTDKIKKSRISYNIFRIGLTGLFIFLVVLTEERIGIWSRDRRLWADAIIKDPENSIAQHNLGFVLAREGELEAAINHYHKALRNQPGWAEAHNNLGVAFFEQGRLKEAVLHYTEALRIKPNYAEAYYNLGVVRAFEGKLKEATTRYKEALRIQPGLARAHYNLGVILFSRGELPEARAHFEEVLRIKPGFVRAYYNLGVLRARQDRMGEAIDYFTEALRLKPDYAEAHHNLGMALAALGKFKEAIGHYHRALKYNPGDVRTRESLDRALAGQHSLEDSFRQLDPAIDPEAD